MGTIIIFYDFAPLVNEVLQQFQIQTPAARLDVVEQHGRQRQPGTRVELDDTLKIAPPNRLKLCDIVFEYVCKRLQIWTRLLALVYGFQIGQPEHERVFKMVLQSGPRGDVVFCERRETLHNLQRVARQKGQ